MRLFPAKRGIQFEHPTASLAGLLRRSVYQRSADALSSEKLIYYEFTYVSEAAFLPKAVPDI